MAWSLKLEDDDDVMELNWKSYKYNDEDKRACVQTI